MVTTIATSESAVVSAIAVQVNAVVGNDADARLSSSSLLDLNDAPAIEVDVLEQLKTNMAQLEDLHARLRFVMSEISYLLKR